MTALCWHCFSSTGSLVLSASPHSLDILDGPWSSGTTSGRNTPITDADDILGASGGRTILLPATLLLHKVSNVGEWLVAAGRSPAGQETQQEDWELIWLSQAGRRAFDKERFMTDKVWRQNHQPQITVIDMWWRCCQNKKSVFVCCDICFCVLWYMFLFVVHDTCNV